MANRTLPTEVLGLIRAAQRQSCHRPWRLASTCPQSATQIHRPFSTRPQHQQTTSAPSSSVSAAEVSHFSRLASSWWDPHGPSRLLHLMNPLRHTFINSCRDHPLPTSPAQLSYLDVGCGGGIFATSAARLPSTASVVAIDPTPEVIRVAKTKQRTDPALFPPKLTYRECSIESLAADPEFLPVDILTVFEVLEHVSSPSQFLSLCLPLIKPGGWLIGSTIARHPVSYITTVLLAEAPVIGVVPRGTHDWKKYINPEEIGEWCAGQSSLGEVRTQGVVYLPGMGWKMVDGSDRFGNYFWGVQKLEE